MVIVRQCFAASLLLLQLVIRLVIARLPRGRDHLLALVGQGAIFC
jgi:hypothetical protein